MRGSRAGLAVGAVGVTGRGAGSAAGAVASGPRGDTTLSLVDGALSVALPPLVVVAEAAVVVVVAAGDDPAALPDGLTRLTLSPRSGNRAGVRVDAGSVWTKASLSNESRYSPPPNT